VTLGEYENIAPFPSGIPGIVLHDAVQIQRMEYFHQRKSAGKMPRAAAIGREKDLFSQFIHGFTWMY
jgi:hypothetical protein